MNIVQKKETAVIQLKTSEKGTAGRASTKAWTGRKHGVMTLASVLQYAPSGFLDGFSQVIPILLHLPLPMFEGFNTLPSMLPYDEPSFSNGKFCEVCKM